MPNQKPKSPKKTSVKKSISHADYTERLDKQPKKPFAGTQYYLYFGRQSLTGGKTRKKNKNKRKTYKRKCK